MPIMYMYDRGNWSPARPTKGAFEKLTLHDPAWYLGKETGFEVRICPFQYEKDEEPSKGFIARIFDATNSPQPDVYLPDLPSALMFMREIAPVVQLHIEQERLEMEIERRENEMSGPVDFDL